VLRALARELAQRTAAAPDGVLVHLPLPRSLGEGLRIAALVKEAWPECRVALIGSLPSMRAAQALAPGAFAAVDGLFGPADAWAGLRDMLKAERPADNAPVTSSSEGTPLPRWDGLPLGHYLPLLHAPHPLRVLWSDPRWNRVALGHHLAWMERGSARCSLLSLELHSQRAVERAVDRMGAAQLAGGKLDCQFIDEALSWSVLSALADELQRRRLRLSWWCNVRLDQPLPEGLATRMAASGCIAVSGMPEPTPGWLAPANAGALRLKSFADSSRQLAEAGIMVHAQLKVGFPGQTAESTLAVLDCTRLLFKTHCLHSAVFLHHGPKASSLEADSRACMEALATAVQHFMAGLALDDDVRRWFQQPGAAAPRPKPLQSKSA
jgi:hypothetical protein